MNTLISQQLKSSLDASSCLFKKMLYDQSLQQSLNDITHAFIKTLELGGRIFFVGNGGSAADCQHLAGELISRFQYDRPSLAAIALTVDTSALTAIGNDYGYADVFSRQLSGLGKEGDMLVAISTSGNSTNIIKCIEMAQVMKIATVGFTGNRAGKMDTMCDLLLKIPSTETPRIQEGHIACGHAICETVEAHIFPQSNKLP